METLQKELKELEQRKAAIEYQIYILEKYDIDK